MASHAATAFYHGLRAADGEIDTDRAAVALHDAVRVMRDQWPEDPFRWAPYLHAAA
jgi:hypothetical protein